MTRVRSGSMRRRHQRGVSLLEVLIAVFVLAVGLLGTATLQLTSKRANLEARDRVSATLLAQGFIERMRVNPRELATYTDEGVGRVLDGTTITAIDCTSECTDQEIAQFDMYQLEQGLRGEAEQIAGNPVGGIGEPHACIDGPAGGSGIYSIAIAWRGLTPLSDPTLHGCGSGSGVYDSSDGTQPDIYRRVLLVTTYVSVPL